MLGRTQSKVRNSGLQKARSGVGIDADNLVHALEMASIRQCREVQTISTHATEVDDERPCHPRGRAAVSKLEMRSIN